MAQNWYEWAALGTLAGAAGAVIVLGNTARSLFGIRGPWVPFLVSILLTYAGAATVDKLQAWPDWVLAFLNGCLLFCTDTGGQEIAVKGSQGQPPPPLRPQGFLGVRWLSSWLT
jgi:hypothetical protein